MTADEYEAAFHGIDLPETLELYTGVNVFDVKGFIEKEVYTLRTSSSKRVMETCKHRLDRALALIQEGSADERYQPGNTEDLGR